MVDFNKIIKDLLIEKDSLNLPGIGGFIKKNKQASISSSQGTILPPSKEIVFSKFNTEDDKKIFNYLVNKLNFDPAIAEKELKTFIERVEQSLLLNEEYNIEGLGTLKKLGNYIEFDPAVKSEELADNFGLDLIEIDTPDENEPVDIVGELPDNSQNKVIWTIVILALLLAPTIFLTITKTNIVAYFKGELNPTQEISVDEEIAEARKQIYGFDSNSSTEVAEPEQVISEQKTNEVEAKLDEITTKENALQIPDNTIKNDYYAQFSTFYLVAGSFETYDNAMQHKSLLIKDGFTQSKVISSNGRYRVVINEFSDRSLALQELDKIRRDYSAKVWVLSSK